MNTSVGLKATGSGSRRWLRLGRAEPKIFGSMHLLKRNQDTFGRDLEDVISRKLTLEEAIKDGPFSIMTKQRLKVMQRDWFEQLDLLDLDLRALRMIDVHRLIGEVAARNGIRVEPGDPAFALVTLNQLVLEEAIVQIREHIRSGHRRVHGGGAQDGSARGNILAEEVREAAAGIREELQRDVETARVGAREIVYEVHRQHTKVAMICRCAAAGVLAAAMFATGLCIGAYFIR